MRIRWRGFELPTKVVCEEATKTETYAKFMAEPFGVVVDGPLLRSKAPAKIKGEILGVQSFWCCLLGNTVPSLLANQGKVGRIRNVCHQYPVFRIHSHLPGLARAPLPAQTIIAHVWIVKKTAGPGHCIFFVCRYNTDNIVQWRTYE